LIASTLLDKKVNSNTFLDSISYAFKIGIHVHWVDFRGGGIPKQIILLGRPGGEKSQNFRGKIPFLKNFGVGVLYNTYTHTCMLLVKKLNILNDVIHNMVRKEIFSLSQHRKTCERSKPQQRDTFFHLLERERRGDA
jgi:hypothetical protein